MRVRIVMLPLHCGTSDLYRLWLISYKIFSAFERKLPWLKPLGYFINYVKVTTWGLLSLHQKNQVKTIFEQFLSFYQFSITSHTFRYCLTTKLCITLFCSVAVKLLLRTAQLIGFPHQIFTLFSIRYFLILVIYNFFRPSVLWHCWLGVRKSIRPVKIEW